MATGVPHVTQSIDFENLKWLVNNGYLQWWGSGSGPDTSTYPDALVQNWEDFEFYIGTGNNGGTDNECDDWGSVDGWKEPAQIVSSSVAGYSASLFPDDDAVHLQWNDIQNESGYVVEMSNYGLSASVASNATSYNWSGLNEDTQYSFRVRPYRSRNPRWYDTLLETIYGKWSDTITGTTRLRAVTGESATQMGTTQIQYNFTDNSANETEYRIYRNANGGSWSIIYSGTLGHSTAATGARTFNDTGLSPSTTYNYYTILVRLGVGSVIENLSVESAGASATTQAAPPTSITAFANCPTSIEVQWFNGGYSGDWTTEVDRRSGHLWESVATGLTFVSINGFYSDTDLTTLESYYYRVRHYSPTYGYTAWLEMDEIDAVTWDCP